MSPTYSICKNHGYLTGEQYTCPHCGEKTEVYSRITGYYRPVQNWNDGKSQEFKDRKVYDIGRSRLSHAKPITEAPVAEECAPAECSVSKAILFATPTCPNCKLAAALLDKAGIAYDKIFADEHADLVEKYGIKQAPTLVLPTENGFEKFRGVSDIKGYLMGIKS